jgi:hypothetical protein
MMHRDSRNSNQLSRAWSPTFAVNGLWEAMFALHEAGMRAEDSIARSIDTAARDRASRSLLPFGNPAKGRHDPASGRSPSPTTAV